MNRQTDAPPAPTSSMQATESATPLFIDTGAFYARMDEDDAHHARATAVTVLHADEPLFAATCEEFFRYDDQEISLVDHATGVLADDRDVEHVFTFDPDDFRTLGFTVVPDDTGEV